MPSPAKPTAREEKDFMTALLADLDSDFFNPVPPSPELTSRKNAIPAPDASSLKDVSTKPIACLSWPHDSPTPTTVRPPQNPVAPDDVDIAALLEGAEDWDMNMSDDEYTKDIPRTHTEVILPNNLIREHCTRCVVEQVTLTDFAEKRLIVKVDGLKVTEKREVILKQDWIYTAVEVGDLINVLGEFTPFSAPSSSAANLTSTITLTSRANMIILHPDLLLSATTIANAPSCLRKPLISTLLYSNAPSPPSSAESETVRSSIAAGRGGSMVLGNFLHEVMQLCLESGRWDKQWIGDCIEGVLTSPDGLGELLKLGVGVETARSEISARSSGIEEFAERYVGQTVKSNALLTDPHTDGSASYVALTALHGIEEDIWCPAYGLKGKLDASVQARIERKNAAMTEKLKLTKPQQSVVHSWTMPFEIKTGRTTGLLEHRAQTMLYTLLMGERYGVEVPSGLLYYTQSKQLMRVSAVRNELRGLIIARNELASYMMRKRGRPAPETSINACLNTILPATIDDDYKCAKCYAVDGCMLYRKAVEGVSDDSSPICALYAEKTSHLTPAQCDFFKKWEALITLEEQDAVRFRKELWTLKAEEREKTGRCFANMIVRDYKHDLAPGVARVHRYVYHFVKATKSPSPQGSKSSLLNGTISAGDAVTVSVEPDLLALARGFVVEVKPQHIIVGFDHEVDLRGILKRTRSIDRALDEILCRLDKDEFTGGMGRIRDNLARLFYVNGNKRLLSLVVDLAPPIFEEDLASEEFDFPSNLNLNQQDAVRKVLRTKDYAIVLGMPGTGKTTTIAEIIKVLVKRGNTVLLASYTHSAVDNILLKLDDADFSILRLGSIDKVHPDARKYTLAHQNRPTTIEHLEHQILRPPVVATTCLSLDNALFARRSFDYCIVDEASQITLPTCLGPLRYARKFVLVGDHFQLPPLVRSRDARAGGLDVSLFRRLADAHPAAVVELAYQYRMNKDIMFLSNKLIYGDRLRCGSESVAQRSLVLPNKIPRGSKHLNTCQPDSCWMGKLLDERCKAMFVDTDKIPGEESRLGDLVQNEVEAKLVYHVTEALLLSGVKQNQIGIISLYRQQIKLLSQFLHKRNEIELLTADKSQGRDKDCIIISMVRSNPAGQVGELLKDWRRINVSFTRARSKLIIFGSSKTLRAAPVLKEFFHLMESKKWIISLPPGADSDHAPSAEAHIATLKRNAAAEFEDRENHTADTRKKTKKMKTERGVLKGRPLLQDVVNNMG